MLNSSRSALVFALAAASLCGATFVVSGSSQAPAASKQTTEKHLANIRQLTHGGENAEAYFSPDGTRLIFQSTRAGYPCDQIYTMKIDGTDERRVSNGTGRTTCGYFYPGGQADPLCVDARGVDASARRSRASRAATSGRSTTATTSIARTPTARSSTPLTRTPGYDAEATIAPDGLIVFTSVRDGDMEIYSMKADGSDVKRLTNRPGPDGGPFFSWDGKQIAFRGRTLDAGRRARRLPRAAEGRPLAADVSSSCS